MIQAHHIQTETELVADSGARLVDSQVSRMLPGCDSALNNGKAPRTIPATAMLLDWTDQ